MNTEEQRAIREGECNRAADDYFAARPLKHSLETEDAFREGFNRGHDATIPLDRQGRGEPVAYIGRSGLADLSKGKFAFVYADQLPGDIPLYREPQPAKPVGYGVFWKESGQDCSLLKSCEVDALKSVANLGIPGASVEPVFRGAAPQPAASAEPCKTCGGTGVVDDGEIDCYANGEPYENGPVKCVKDCPDCAAPVAAQPIVPELGSAIVNEACWKFVEAMPQVLAGPIFNDLKPALYAAICHVLAAPPADGQPRGYDLCVAYLAGRHDGRKSSGQAQQDDKSDWCRINGCSHKNAGSPVWETPPAQQDADPPDLQNLTNLLLAPIEIVREELGEFSHPHFPYLDEDIDVRLFFSVFGLECEALSMDDDIDEDHPASVAYGNGGAYSAWTPPSREGWTLISIHDTEDGPQAVYVRAAMASKAPPFDLVLHLYRQRRWSERTFGPGARSQGVVDHIRKELLEIEADPGDIKEWIDVVILALDGAWRSGATPVQIVEALVAKQIKNEGRTWPDWRMADPTKAIEHDRSKDSSAQQEKGHA